MKKIAFNLVLILCAVSWFSGIAQITTSPSVFPSAGGYITGSGTDFSWTIGEPVYSTFNGVSNIVSQGFQQPEIQIYTGNVSTTLCAGANVSVPFTSNGIIGPNNVYTAQLSNASGSFTAAVNIGNVIGNTSGVINATIPLATPAGTGYRIRVISSLPVFNGEDNGNDITVSIPSTWYLDADNDNYYTGTVITQCVSPGAGYKTSGIISGGDCNDGNNAIHPGAIEICGNGIDEDCNGSDLACGITLDVQLDVTGTQIICPNSTLVVHATATFVGCSSSSLQWYEDGAPIAGATGSQLTLNRWSVGKFYVKATCGSSSVYSDTLNVNIVELKADSNRVCAATGLLLQAPIFPGATYQWYEYDMTGPILGTAATYITTYIGNVWCKVYSGSCYKYGKFRTFESNACLPVAAKRDESETYFVNEEELTEPDFGFSMYPNPANSQLNILSSYLSGTNQIIIYDLNGRLVLQQRNLSGNRHTLEISSLSPAVYIVELTADGITDRKRLVVQ